MISLWLRLLLIDAGGQFYWPDEVRYFRSRQAAATVLSGDFRTAAAALYSPDHFLFKVIGIIPALAEMKIGPDPRIPAYFLAIFSTLNIWLIWQVARRSGAGPKEALIVAGFFAASNSIFYYSRHILPYDPALTFALAALLAAVGGTGKYLSAFAVGLAAGGTILTYNGYWIIAVSAMALGALPLTPDDTAQTTAYPAVKFQENALYLRQPEVVHPSPEQRRQLLDQPDQITSSPSAKFHFQLLFQTPDSRRSHFQFRLQVRRHTVAKELTLPRSIDFTLLLVDRKLQPPRQTRSPTPKGESTPPLSMTSTDPAWSGSVGVKAGTPSIPSSILSSVPIRNSRSSGQAVI